MRVSTSGASKTQRSESSVSYVKSISHITCSDFSSRVGQLEQKLDSIVSFLSQSQPPLPPLTQQLPLLPLTQSLPSVSIAKFPPDHSLPAPAAPPLLPSPPKSYGGSPSSTPSGFSGSSALLDFNLSPIEEESRLDLFRQITQYFPFVVIPPSTSAHILRREKPFLFAAIMLAASNGSSSYKKCIGRKLMEYLSVHLILNGERSFDLLLGTLVFTTWYVQLAIDFKPPSKYSETAGATNDINIIHKYLI